MILEQSPVMLPIYEHLFTNSKKPYLLFHSTPGFPIAEVNLRYLEVTGTIRADLIGYRLKDIFHKHSNYLSFLNKRDFLDSLTKVKRDGAQDIIDSKKMGEIAVIDDDVPQKRYWRAVNTPVFDSDRKTVLFILHQLDEIPVVTAPPEKISGLPSVLGLLADALRSSEKRYESIINSSMDAFVCIDRHQRVIIFNLAAEKMFCCSANDAIGSHIERFIPLRFREAHGDHIKKFIASGITARTMGDLPQVSGLRTTGEEFPIEASISVVDIKEKIASVIIRDVSLRTQTLKSLAAREEKLRFVTEAANIGYWDWNIVANTVEWSDECKKIFGLPTDFVIDYEGFIERVHPDDRTIAMERIQCAMTSSGIYDSEYRICLPDNSVRWINSRGQVEFTSDKTPVRMGGITIDITKRKEMEFEIQRSAQTDSLTGLPNRAAIFQSIEHLISGATRGHYSIAFLFIDLDKFKPINDSYGHGVGDAVLREVANRLKSCVRGEDFVGRLGGDEFLAVLSHIHDEKDAAKVATNILYRLNKSYLIDGLELQASPSIGISLYPKDGGAADKLIKKADTAMYHVKEAGRNSFQFYRNELNSHVKESSFIERNLKKGLQNNEFELFFQPIMDFALGIPVAAEALIRWPAMNIEPTVFVPIAEATGFMKILGDWVIKEACRTKSAWNDAGFPTIPIAINISASQFREKNFTDHVLEIVQHAVLLPEDFIIELSENALMQNREAYFPILSQLRNMGMKISLDNFGAGFSSMNCLNKVPIDILKLDKTFICAIEKGDSNSCAIIDATLCIARSLNLKVIAEGIESEEVIAFLTSRNCRYGQGYLFSRPLPADQFQAWCSARL